MKKYDFLAELQEILQAEEALQESTKLETLEEWDSIAFMVLIAFFDRNFGKKLTFEDLAAVKTPEDLISLSQGEIE